MSRKLVTPAVSELVGETVVYTAPEAVSLASIRYFALAIGSDPARWREVAPPTFVCETNQLTGIDHPDGNGYIGHTWTLPFPEPVDMIRGGNDYVFAEPLRPGDDVTTRWRLASITERLDRASDSMAIVEAEARYERPDGGLLATNTETLIYRPSSRQPTRAPAEQDSEPVHPWSAPDASPASAEIAANGRIDPSVGAVLPPLRRRLALADLVAYGAATWDWHRLHFDTDFAIAAGMSGPIVDGQMFGALLAELVIAWAGPEAKLERLFYRNRAAVVVGHDVICEGRVTALDHSPASEQRQGSGDDSRSARVEIELRVVVDGRAVVGPAGAEMRRPASSVGGWPRS